VFSRGLSLLSTRFLAFRYAAWNVSKKQLPVDTSNFDHLIKLGRQQPIILIASISVILRMTRSCSVSVHSPQARSPANLPRLSLAIPASWSAYWLSFAGP
jgi:hypothetical protein